MIAQEIKNGSLGIDRKATAREENAPVRAQIEVRWILRHTEASSGIGPTARKEPGGQAISELTTVTVVAGAAVRAAFEEGAVFVVEEEDSGEAVAGAEGAGLRFNLDKKNHMNYRIDFAYGRDGHTISIGIGEAF